MARWEERQLQKQIDLLKASNVRVAEARPDFSKYRDDPGGFARDVLGVEHLWEPIEQALLSLLKPPYKVSIDSGHNIGKAQACDLVIDTPDGKRRFGDLKPGDRVFGSDGSPTEVKAVHPQGVRPMYRVTFDDGSSTLADGDHLWRVRGRSGRRRANPVDGGWETLTTAEILARGVKRPNGVLQARQWEIPCGGPVEYPAREVPVPAYSLGAWLGDGTVGAGRVTTADDEMVESLRTEASGVTVCPGTGLAVNVWVRGLRGSLRKCGALKTPTHQKRVPAEYMENSVEVRLAVLQGLMDTDGTADARGVATFCSTSEGLVDDVIWLVRSLGGKARKQPTPKRGWYRGKDGERIDGRLAYQATVRLDAYPLFRLTRKQARMSATAERFLPRWIDEIEVVEPAEAVCIEVAAADRLYMTSDFIVTHNSHSMAIAVLWWFYTRPTCWIITTAPTDRDVKDILWTQIRLLHKNAKIKLPNDLMPAAPEMRSSDDHVAKGYTARDANSAVGRHRENMLFLFDEKEGVIPVFWDGMKSMLRPGSGDAVMVVGNPHTTTTRAYFEHNRTNPDGTPAWTRVRLSSIDHPNVADGLAGLPERIPGAVTCKQIDGWVADWCDPVVPGDERPTDFAWRGRMWRAGPIGEPRILGLRPSAGTDGVWSEAAFSLTLGPIVMPPPDTVPVIGCDVAGYGYDFSAIHTRCGGVSLTHEAGTGWTAAKIADRLMETADRMAAWYEQRRPFAARQIGGVDVPINIEDDMQGRAVQSVLAEKRYNFVPVNASSRAHRDDKYPSRRSELWFKLRERAVTGGVNFSLLPKDVQERLQQQLLAPKWAPDSKGRRVVEPKEDTKKTLGRSPDDADAALIAYIEPADMEIVVAGSPHGGSPRAGVPQTRRDWATERGLYGVKKPGGR